MERLQIILRFAQSLLLTLHVPAFRQLRWINVAGAKAARTPLQEDPAT
jgi:hypothetical protein